MSKFKVGDRAILARQHHEEGRFGLKDSWFRDQVVFTIDEPYSSRRAELRWKGRFIGVDLGNWIAYDSMLDPARVDFPGGVRYRVQHGPNSFIQAFDPKLDHEALVAEALGRKDSVFVTKLGVICGKTPQDTFTLMRMD